MLTRLRRRLGSLLGYVRAAELARRIPWSPPERVHPPAPRETIETPAREGFDGSRAFALLDAQCALGPRHPGSAGHARMLELLLEQLGDVTDEVWRQSWNQRVARGPGAGRTFPLTNVLGLVRGSRTSPGNPARVMVSAHWDSRPVADRDPVPERRSLPVPGANDGASGVAVLLELARVLKEERPATTVAFGFWDGEDFGEYYYGSRMFGKWLHRREMDRWRASAGVVVDMVGARGLRCVTEAHSMELAPGVWSELHAVAAELGVAHRFGGPLMRINDDHVFLSRGGIPTALLIGYEYPEWHTIDDQPDRCDAEALGMVGRVLERWVRGAGR